MQRLKELVDVVRNETRSTSPLSEGSDRSIFTFDSDTFPNASQYSESNTGVGRKLQAEKESTLSIIGETAIKGLGIPNPLKNVETLGFTKPLLKAFINNEPFLINQAKLHSINRLSGKTYNPIGILASYMDDEIDGKVGDSALSQVLQKTTSRLLRSLGTKGTFRTTDGETFYGVVDDDVMDDQLTLEGFKTKIGDGGGTLRSIAQNFLGNINPFSNPSRSIVAQVLAYSNTHFNDLLEKNEGWVGIKDGTRDKEISPMSEKSINYIYGGGLAIDDPQKYLLLRQKIKNGLMASNVMVSKPDGVVEEENQARGKYNNVIDRIFDVNISTPSDFYVNNTKEYDPFKDGFVSSLMRYYLLSIKDSELAIKEGEVGDLKNEWTYKFLQKISQKKIKDNNGSAPNRLQEIEDERLKKIISLNGFERSELKSYRKTTTQPEGKKTDGEYQFHNIQVELGSNFRSRLKDNSFKNLKKISEEFTANDIVQISDIKSVGEDTNFDTNMFMSIEDIRNKKIIYLRPTFENISEDLQINNGDIQYFGRTEPFPNYENTTRSVTMSFKLYSDTPNEFLMMWKKMNFLNSLAYPTGIDTMFSPLLRFSIGDLYKGVGGYLNTLNYLFSNSDVSWETEKGLMAPKIIDVSMSFSILHDKMPYVDINNKFQFDDSNSFNSYGVNFDYGSEV